MRLNFGSHPLIKSVLEVDTQSRSAVVKLQYADGSTRIDTVGWGEVEPYDRNQPYNMLSIGKALTDRAQSVVPATV